MSRLLCSFLATLLLVQTSFIPAFADKLKIPSETSIPVTFKHQVVSDQIELGDSLNMVIDKDVTINGVVVFEAGSEGISYVEKSKQGRYWGRGGLVEIKSAQFTDVAGNKHNCKIAVKRKGSSKTTGIVMPVVGALIFLPLMLFGFRKGENVTINPGVIFDAFTTRSKTIEI